MKKLLIATIALSFNATAADYSVCKELSVMAGTIMDLRQSNSSMPKLMETVGDSEIAQSLVIDAYSAPLYSLKSNKEKKIKEFENDTYVACVKQLSKG